MREAELRRFFRRIVVAAVPIPLSVSVTGCGGSTGIGGAGGGSSGGAGGAGGAPQGICDSPQDAGVFLGTRVLLDGSTGVVVSCPGVSASDASAPTVPFCSPPYCVAVGPSNGTVSPDQCRALCNSLGPRVLG